MTFAVPEPGVLDMLTMTPAPQGKPQDEEIEPDFVPLSAEEARAWRARNPSISPWRVVGGQAVAGVLATVVAWFWRGEPAVAWSVAYGALAVLLPAALFARGLTGRLSSVNPGAAMMGFFLWELAKIGLTVLVLLAAPRLVPGLSWLALLAGFVVTMKVYWVAMWLRPARRKSVVKI